jgi:hypothetical protein
MNYRKVTTSEKQEDKGKKLRRAWVIFEKRKMSI